MENSVWRLFDITVAITFRLHYSSTISWCETHWYYIYMYIYIYFLQIISCLQDQTQNQRTDAALLLSVFKPPPVRKEQTAVSELTSEPLRVCVCVCLWVCPPVWPTACLYSRRVSVLFARVSLLVNIGRERAKRKKDPLLCISHKLRNVVSHLSLQKATVWSANKRKHMCVTADEE